MKTMKKYLLTVLALMLVLALTGCKAQKVDLSSYMTLEYRGVNGNSQAYLDIDYSGFEYEIMEGWKEKDKDFEHLGKLTALEMSFQVQMSKTEGLKNGDQVDVTVTYDQEKAQELGVELTGTSRTFTVEGLKDAQVIDPFAPEVFGEGKEIEFHLEGISPHLRLEMTESGGFNETTHGILYEADLQKDIANGDVITVKASFENPEELNRVLSRTEAQFTVDGYPRYLEDFADINGQDLEKLSKALQEEYKQYMKGLFHLDIAEISDKASMESSTNCRVHFETAEAFTIQDYGFVNCNNDENPRLNAIVLPFCITLRNIEWIQDEEDQFLDSKSVFGYAIFRYIIVDSQGNLMAMPNEKPYLKIQDTLYENSDKMLERAHLERADLQ